MPYPSPVSSYTLPTIEPTASPWPSPGTSATGAPTSTTFNYFPAGSLTQSMTGEGATSTKAWVIIDTAGMSTSQDTNGQQRDRIRSTGSLTLPDRFAHP